MIGAILQTLVAGFVIGGLARWAVPGPDPMPIWMTTFLGLAGAVAGTSIALAVFGREIDSGTAFSAWLLSILFAALLLIFFRRFVQKRPLTGPDAHRPPANPPGRPGRGLFTLPPKSEPEREDVTEQIRKLAELRDAGTISDDEFERKKAELLARL